MINYLIKIICSYLLKKSENIIYPTFLDYTRTQIFSNYIKKHSENFKDLKIGDIYTRTINVTLEYRNAYRQFMTKILPFLFVHLITCIICFYIDKNLGIMVFISLIALLIVVLYYKNSILEGRIKTETKYYENTDNINNIFSNLMNIYINNQEKKEQSIITNDNTKYKQLYIKTSNSQINLGISISIIGAIISLCIIYYIIKYRTIDSKEIIFVVLLLTHYSKNTTKLSKEIPGFFHSLGTCMTSIKYFNNILTNNENKQKSGINKGEIVFSNVFFGYKHEDYVITNFNLIIKSGEKIAIIGRSGSGKTTLVKLLIKLYPYQGKIYIDNINIQNFDSAYLRSNVIYINQKTNLSDNNIIKNIKYGNDNITNNDVINF